MTVHNPADVANIDVEVIEIEKHLHNHEHWFGKRADQSGDEWAEEDSLTPFRVTSGNNAFGADADDEALAIGLDDTPITAGLTRYDCGRIVVSAASNSNDSLLRYAWGATTLAQAIIDGNHSEFMIQEAKKGTPVMVRMPRLVCGTDKLWMQLKNGTDNATVDFFVGIHEYEV